MHTVKDETPAPGPPDERLFCAAYREFSPAVLSYLRARNVEDPEGLTQEVFLALYPQLGSVCGGMKGVKSLAFSIAHARYVDEHRRRLKAPATTDYTPEADPRCSDSAEDQLLAVEGSGNVKDLLSVLQPEQQEVIALRVVADLSVETTAEIMGKTPGAIKQLQRRALCRLRKLRPALREDRS
ncbi:sigma-70 family RNA polymerase sigma factor [Arthrobacter sp. NQ7]|jgi:RNA polymerase sigma-70 factor (ECF subfamily)|uniref:RNA polymerase sigma factor n=1 Tax=Arthrobacter sp. NQ7 TaxID=3032303 RepID=UPI00240FA572|nr:sigma-70 family RNA polymerase sigma factor [Arthrobacter sp. NQ7]MDJ0457436.1 sigma-70 family RNA polymerase sigma factor [Arthrobacter sp. NQ7]